MNNYLEQYKATFNIIFDQKFPFAEFHTLPINLKTD